MTTPAPDPRAEMALGKHWSFNLRSDPKRFGFVLARYAVAAKLLTPGQQVLELGCSEGIGSGLLGATAASYTGVDFDAEAIAQAKRNWPTPRYEFLEADFLNLSLPPCDVVVSLDVVEHIERDREELFFGAVSDQLKADGMAVIGTPNLTAAAYQSEASQRGHVNLFSGDRLVETLRRRFEFVFLFGMNDELVHTGYTPMCHYLLAVACQKRTQEQADE